MNSLQARCFLKVRECKSKKGVVRECKNSMSGVSCEGKGVHGMRKKKMWNIKMAGAR